MLFVCARLDFSGLPVAPRRWQRRKVGAKMKKPPERRAASPTFRPSLALARPTPRADAPAQHTRTDAIGGRSRTSPLDGVRASTGSRGGAAVAERSLSRRGSRGAYGLSTARPGAGASLPQEPLPPDRNPTRGKRDEHSCRSSRARVGVDRTGGERRGSARLCRFPLPNQVHSRDSSCNRARLSFARAAILLRRPLPLVRALVESVPAGVRNPSPRALRTCPATAYRSADVTVPKSNRPP